MIRDWYRNRPSRLFILAILVSLCLGIFAFGQQRQPRPPRPGIKDPGIQRPMSTVSPIAVFQTDGTPDWQVLTEDSVWVANGPKNTIHRLDAKTNTITATIEVGKRP